MTPLYVVLGAAVAAPLRLLVARLSLRYERDQALGTLVVNAVGSVLLGVLLGLADLSDEVFALVGVGFCGALTTFSTFGVDVVRLVEERTVLRALAYVVGSLVLGIGGAAAAYVAVQAIQM